MNEVILAILKYRAAPGKSGLHARGEGDRVLALESREGLGPRDALKKDSRGLCIVGMYALCVFCLHQSCVHAWHSPVTQNCFPGGPP